MQVGREEHTCGRKGEAKGAESQTSLLAKVIRNGSGQRTADNATDQGTSRRPSCAGRIEMK